MKRSKEIKKGLECCASVNAPCESCSFRTGTSAKCIRHMSECALAYIQQLEAAQHFEKHLKEAGSEGCEWCKPSDDGDYTMSVFVNPNDLEQEAKLSVYGGQIVMEIKMDENSPKARMAVKINHCPMCGRAFVEADRNGN